MKFNTYLYYSLVLLIFTVLLFSVRHIVNTHRIIISSEELIDPVSIFWEVDKSDSLLRVKEPLYLGTNFILIDHQKNKYENDSAIYNELFADSIPNKGSVVNLNPPYVLWKLSKNDTIKVFKNNKTLSFVKSVN